MDADCGRTQLGRDPAGPPYSHPVHTRPLEVRVFNEVGLRTVWLGGKKDMGSHQQLELVIRH